MAQFNNYSALPPAVPAINGYDALINHFINGYKAAAMPGQMRQQQQAADLMNKLNQYKLQMAPEELKQAQLANQMQQLQNQYLPKQQAQELALRQAQLNQIKNPAPKQYEPTEIEQLVTYRNQFPKGSAEYNQIDAVINKKGALSNGTEVTLADGTKLSVGGQSSQGLKPGTLAVDQNGNQITMPTTAQQTRLQRAIVGIENVKPYVDVAVKDLSPFQSGWTSAHEKIEEITNPLIGGTSLGRAIGTDLPSKKATGESSIKAGAESLVNAFGLNSTEGNIETMSDILRPHSGETQEGYSQRLYKQVTDFVNQQNRLKSAARGINVSDSSSNIQQEKSIPASKSIDLSQWSSLPDSTMITITDRSGNSKKVTVAQAKQMGIK